MRIKKYKNRLIYTGKNLNKLAILEKGIIIYSVELWHGNNGKKIFYEKLSTACKICRNHIEGKN